MNDFDQEEQLLHAQKENYEQAGVPDTIDAYIDNGIALALHDRKKTVMRRTGVLAASFMLVFMVVSIRVSPVFASIVGQIPGMSYIVKLIEYDKGLLDAVENDFFQPVGASDEHDGIRFTVDGVIVDEVRMNIFYTVESDLQLRNQHFTVLAVDGKGIPDVSISCCDNISGQGESSKIHQGKIELNAREGVRMPDDIVVQAKIETYASLDAGIAPIKSTWNVPVTVDREKFASLKETIEIDKTVVMDGQRIVFKRTTVYPTRIALEVEFDPNNSKRIFGIDGLKLVNEKGVELTTSLTFLMSEHTHMVQFESNYFSKPKHLYVVGGSIRALDKDKLKLKLNLAEEKVVEAPDDRISVLYARPSAEYPDMIEVALLLSGVEENDGWHYNIVNSPFVDAGGHVYSVGPYSHSSTRSPNEREIMLQIPSAIEYADPLTFDIINYPARITKEFKVQIK